MFDELAINNKYFYHHIISVIMLVVWIYVGIKGYRIKDFTVKRNISILIISVCLTQEVIDFINRLFLDSNYLFSIQRDLPFLQFCQISFYFSLLCIFLSKKAIARDGKYSSNQFLFDCSFLLGFSGAFQGIITPDFLNINNLLGVICIQLQHSLIILNLIWLMCAYNYRLKFTGVCLTYLFINIIAPFALLLNNFLGINPAGTSANYFYVNELPIVDNFFLNFVSQYPSQIIFYIFNQYLLFTFFYYMLHFS